MRTASELLGKRYFLSVRKHSECGTFSADPVGNGNNMDGKKRAFGGRNEEYPFEGIRANIQEGLKKVGVLSHPDSRYQGKEKHPLDPSSSTHLHLRQCQRWHR